MSNVVTSLLWALLEIFVCFYIGLGTNAFTKSLKVSHQGMMSSILSEILTKTRTVISTDTIGILNILHKSLLG